MLVVGSGPSGVQIAAELQRAGRAVHLSFGRHDQPPRAYRGRDFVWWLGVLGKWDDEGAKPGKGHVTIAVSGAHGGHAIDSRALARRGMTLVGRTRGIDSGIATFEPDLADNLAGGDANYLALLIEADAYVARNGLDLPQEPGAREIPPDPACVRAPSYELDLAGAGVRAIVRATGYRNDFGWLPVDAFDGQGRPGHQPGVSSEPGVHSSGVPRLSRRGSSFIWGVWHDARRIAAPIATQRSYLDHHRARRQRERGAPCADA